MGLILAHFVLEYARLTDFAKSLFYIKALDLIKSQCSITNVSMSCFFVCSSSSWLTYPHSSLVYFSVDLKATMSILKIHAREIFDSRGNPTVEVDLYTKKGIVYLPGFIEGMEYSDWIAWDFIEIVPLSQMAKERWPEWSRAWFILCMGLIKEYQGYMIR